MKEPQIIINGTLCTEAQAMALRVAAAGMWAGLREGLGDDRHGRGMAKLYLDRLAEVRALMRVEP